MSKPALEAMNHSRQQLLNSVDFLQDATFVLDNNKKVIIWNTVMEELTGISKEELISKDLPPLYGVLALTLMEIAELNDERLLSGIKHIKIEKNAIEAEIFSPVHFISKNSYFWIKGSYLFDNDGNRNGYVETFHDITERKQKEYQLIKTTRVLSVLSRINYAIINIHEKERLLQEICNISVKYGKFCMAWIGITTNGDEKFMKYLPQDTIEDDILYKVSKDIIGDNLNKDSPAGIAIKEGRKIVCNDIANDPLMIPWKKEALKVGYHSSVTIPINFENKSTGVFTLFAHIPYYFDDEEVKLLANVATNISFAIETIDNESARKQSDERLKALIAATSDVVYRMSPDWSVMNNLKGGHFLSSVEIPIKDWLYTFIPPDTQQEVLAAIKLAISTKSKFELEHKVLRVDGSIGWTFSSAIPILDDKGGIMEWFGIAHDITDRKNAEIRLHQSEERFSKAFHNIPIPATITRSSDNILIDVNNIFLQLFEYSPEEVINHTSSELNLFIDFNERMKSIEILERDGYIRDYELEMFARTGKKLTLLVSSESIIIQEQKHFLTTYFNITERKEIERNLQLLAAIVQYAELPIVSKDLKGNILSWNWGAEKIYGYRADEVIGKNISILIPEGEKNEIPELINKVLNDGKIENYETKRRRKDGTVIPVSINLSLIKSDLIEIIGISNITYDISAIKLAEEKLKNYGVYLEELVKNRTAELEAAKNKAETTAEELMRSNKELQQFAYLTSHDLQEPLRTISTFTQFLSERYHDKFDADGQQFIHYIVESALRMKALLHDLLIYSRVGSNPLTFTRVDFNNLFDKVIYKYRLSIEENNAEITADKLPTVIGDEAQLQQLMMDLIWNALKYCTKSPIIHVSSKEEQYHYHFSIKDNGIGIEPQYAEKVFQIFQRLAHRHEFSGTGMGLAVCKRIVERHGGKIWFESKVGEGTTFYFTIAKNINVPETESKISEANTETLKH